MATIRHRTRPYGIAAALGALLAICPPASSQVQRQTEQQQLPDPDTSVSPFSLFGGAVAIDGSTAVVGAEREGAVYVFYREQAQTSWKLQDRLVSGRKDDLFGHAVAVSGDVLVVGAFGDDAVAPAAGAAYVYEREVGDPADPADDAWSLAQQLRGSGNAIARFGFSVDVLGDLIAVGSPRENRVDLFVRQGSSWEDGGHLTGCVFASSPCEPLQPGAQYGSSVTLGRGFCSEPDIVLLAVGAPLWEDGTGHQVGAAYVHEVSIEGLSPLFTSIEMTLVANDPIPRDLFGRSVAVDGDFVVVGAPGDDGAGQDAGAAHVFHRFSVDFWIQIQEVVPEGTGTVDRVGHSVALYGDVMVVGSNPPRVGGVSNAGRIGRAFPIETTDFGVASVYRETGFSSPHWQEEAQLGPSSPSGGALFGESVDVGGGGVIVGAPLDLHQEAGAAYVYAGESLCDVEDAIDRLEKSSACTGTLPPSCGSISLPHVGSEPPILIPALQGDHALLFRSHCLNLSSGCCLRVTALGEQNVGLRVFVDEHLGPKLGSTLCPPFSPAFGSNQVDLCQEDLLIPCGLLDSDTVKVEIDVAGCSNYDLRIEHFLSRPTIPCPFGARSPR